ncbi:HxlR family transcriptional regulator [Brucella pseudogrignonensis]|uniref:winged helix-turn-helix transcriptional regulator n=1 Tax=Brucella pseudogrignonensis TaxID=419475 RepID=UPI0007DA9B0F|nr:helix-turn-helix domain-containing protein [Brucella pseudogrignonensis]ANG98762.1 HxlR family transcriptional regulator [Brucella pseudogrignonensis]
MLEDTGMEASAKLVPDDIALIKPVLERIADKWTILILAVLCPQPVRFNELKRHLGGITHKSLADALKRLERDGLIVRKILDTTPLGVEYSISPLGQSLRQPFEELCKWARDHHDDLKSE